MMELPLPALLGTKLHGYMGSEAEVVRDGDADPAACRCRTSISGTLPHQQSSCLKMI
jgi:hypothetical protein